MSDALIGHSGFVGSTLLRQRSFDALYRSSTIAEIDGQDFDLVVCAGAPAQKWIANRDPAADAEKLDALMRRLAAMSCRRFVLVSTVDVFKAPAGADEATEPEAEGLHAYGLNRLRLERFVAERFPGALILRLPGLVGPGLRKNVIYDFLNDNNLSAIDSRGVFQFYPMVNLWADIRRALELELELLHLTAEPVSVAEVAREGFGMEFTQHVVETPAVYDFRSRHAEAFGGAGPYQYSRRETMLAIRAYAQSEPPAPQS
ncbi:MAG: pyridine nucleotide transhydrogenase [Pseudomonadota bacterium]